jgi:hypothetical protein
MLLGYLGTADDVLPLVSALKSLHGDTARANWSMTGFILQIATALGHMTRRGVPGANEAFRDKLLDAAFWKESKIEWQQNANSAMRFENFMRMNMLIAYAQVAPADTMELAERTFKDEKDPREKRLIDAELKVLCTHFAERSVIWTKYEKAKRARKDTSVGEPGGPPTSDPSNAMVDEALQEYAKQKQAFLNGKATHQGVCRNDGPTAFLGKEEVAQQVVLLKALQALAPAHEPATVEIEKTTSLAEPARGQPTVAGEKHERVVVRVVLRGTEELRKKHLPPLAVGRTAVTMDERLAIYMVRQDGVWRWNPYGW